MNRRATQAVHDEEPVFTGSSFSQKNMINSKLFQGERLLNFKMLEKFI
jgi:hypothetical protein